MTPRLVIALRSAVAGLATVTLAVAAVSGFRWVGADAWTALRSGGVWSPVDLLLAGTAVAGLAATAWLVVGVGLCVLGRLPGALGAGARILAERWTPVVLRRAVSIAVGGAVAVGAGAGVAHAAPAPGPTPGPTATSTSATGSTASTAQPARTTAPDPGFAALVTVTVAGATPVPVPSPATASSSPSSSASDPAPDPTTGPSTGPTTGAPAATATSAAKGNPPAASRGSGPSTTAGGPGAPTLPTHTPPAVDRQPDAGRTGTVTVARGDSLWRIAARHLGPHATARQVAAEWPRWYAANRAAIGPDPGRLRVGQVLVEPGSGS